MHWNWYVNWYPEQCESLLPFLKRTKTEFEASSDDELDESSAADADGEDAEVGEEDSSEGEGLAKTRTPVRKKVWSQLIMSRRTCPLTIMVRPPSRGSSCKSPLEKYLCSKRSFAVGCFIGMFRDFRVSGRKMKNITSRYSTFWAFVLFVVSVSVVTGCTDDYSPGRRGF